MPQFKIEQVAICPRDPEAAMALLTEMGAGEWAKDHVVAAGKVFGDLGANEANLAFDYQLLDGAREFEVLEYTEGKNWMNGHPRVSHLGMHCTEQDLDEWKVFFADRSINVAQEVYTREHSNPVIAGKRWYHYVIFNTYPILGVDIKFIVRRDQQ